MANEAPDGGNTLPPLPAGEVPIGADGMPDMSNFKMPSKDELLAALDSMAMSDSEKEEIRAALLGKGPLSETGYAWTSQGYILLLFLLIIASIFAFFGYKLYKSLKDKELKREEKKKLKQMKKKK